MRNRKSNNGGKLTTTNHVSSSTNHLTTGKNGKQEVRSSREKVENENQKIGSYLWNVVGVVFAFCVSYRHAAYMAQIHEKNMFFSSILPIERDISFRTESGLYYSYYKQMIEAPSILSGLHELMNDNLTEHPSTINVLQRMNIYQEVILSVLYRVITPIQYWMEPVYFYINTVFALQALLVASLYAMSWMLSRTWLAGLLTALFYTFNKVDTTRVETYMPLRESFALPFLWAQLAAITVYFQPRTTSWERYARSAIYLFTFLFAVTWQFNQFALLLQAMALFGTQVLRLVNHHKLLHVYLALVVSMLLVCLLQFFNPMIPGGILLSFIPAALVVMQLQKFERSDVGVLCKCIVILVNIVLVFALTTVFNMLIKSIIRHEADEHITKFVRTKFGLETSHDFDVRLYLCNGAFSFITFDVFQRLSQLLVFPLYTIAHLALLILLIITTWQVLRKSNIEEGGSCSSETMRLSPQLAYHTVQAVFFGAVAVVTVRMKYFWTPYMCILASIGVADHSIWSWLLVHVLHCNPTARRVSIVRNGAVLLTAVTLLYLAVPPALVELNNLMEFHDPDTVQLMTWINKETPKGAAFTGSMQLLAGVKLCTGRPITNHPHYEDKVLRLKTKELYQIYGRRTAEDVHAILSRYQTKYIILEDSICMARRTDDGCRLPDIIDVTNGIVPDGFEGKNYDRALLNSAVPRFCDEIRYLNDKGHGLNRNNFSRYFKLVFENRTFRVYSVL